MDQDLQNKIAKVRASAKELGALADQMFDLLRRTEKHKMLIVTGGIACGKSTFVETARELGHFVVDADEWYHKLFVGSIIQQHWHKTLFGTVSIKAVAFQHDNWTTYEKIVADAFCEYVRNVKPTICVIPEYFKRHTYFIAALGLHKVLTIERDNHIDAAIARDGHRSAEQTQKIFENQTPSCVRVDLSDWFLYNVGSKDYFKQECELWLKSRLPAVSTHPTKDIDT